MEKLFDFVSGICYIAKKNRNITDNFTLEGAIVSINSIVPIERLKLNMDAGLFDAIANAASSHARN